MAVQLPGADLIREDWGHRVTCDVGHPIGNYAFFMDFEGWKNAAEFPIPNLRAFNLYLNDFELTGPELGIFEERMTLRSLVCCPSKGTREAQFLVEAKRTSEERAEVSEFIVAQFYTASSATVCQKISRSISNSTDLDLFSISDGDNGIAGAAMLTKGTDVWGIYSVCVSPLFQGRGIGRNLVEELCRLAHVSGHQIQLQCAESRLNWYERIGFKTHSFLHVYCV
ncbi:MAG: GNAT family N-acetyltransferase [Fimbriimonadaceae bacterium]